jgi:hypothetical protein
MARKSWILRAYVLVLVAGLALVAADDHELDCYDGPFESVLLDGCVDDCRSFEHLQEAEEHCDNLGASCGGITKTAYGDDEAISLGVGLYEVRAGPGIEAAKGDTTWIKQEGCAPDSGETPQQKAAVGDLMNLVHNHELTPTTQDGTGDYCFSYSAPVQGQYLEGCVDECRSFETLDEAEAHCTSLDDCGGVTHSLYGEGQSWHDGEGPYEVRQGPALKPSQDGDTSWVRIEHPCDETDTSYDDDDDYFADSVREVDQSLLTSIVYLVGLLGAVALVVYVAYVRGHGRVVDLVHFARDKVRSFLQKRSGRPGAPLSSQSNYQSL